MEENPRILARIRLWLTTSTLRLRLVQGGLVATGVSLIAVAAAFLLIGLTGNGPERSSAASLEDHAIHQEERDPSLDLAVAIGAQQSNAYYEAVKLLSDEYNKQALIKAADDYYKGLALLGEALAPTPTPEPPAPPASNPPPRQNNNPPPPPPPPLPSGCPAAGMDGFASALFGAINNERTSRGMAALAANGCVTYVAELRSNDMAANNYFSHTSPSGATAFSLMDQYGVGYGWAGENLARNNYPDNESVGIAIRDLMNSQGHRDNILSPNYTMMGVGFAVDGAGMKYFTMIFIGPG